MSSEENQDKVLSNESRKRSSEVDANTSNASQKKRKLNPSVSFDLDSNSVHTYSKTIPLVTHDSFCAQCLEAFDDYFDENAFLIQCISCSFCFHVSCSKLSPEDLFTLHYICDSCLHEKKQLQVYALKNYVDSIMEMDEEGKYRETIEHIMDEIESYIGKNLDEWINDSTKKLSKMKSKLSQIFKRIKSHAFELKIVPQEDVEVTLKEMIQKNPSQFTKIEEHLKNQQERVIDLDELFGELNGEEFGEGDLMDPFKLVLNQMYSLPNEEVEETDSDS